MRFLLGLQKSTCTTDLMKYELGQILILQFSVDQEGIEESRLNLD